MDDNELSAIEELNVQRSNEAHVKEWDEEEEYYHLKPKKNLYKKLLAIQQEIGAIKKDTENPFFKSMYFDINGLLEAVKPLLNKHGLIVLQPLTNIAGSPAIETSVIEAESGEYIKTIQPLPVIENESTKEWVDKNGIKNIQVTKGDDPQKMGSAITYYRRYALQSLFLLQAEDDDGNSTAHTPTSSYKPQGEAKSYNSGKLATDKQKEFISKLTQEKKGGAPKPEWLNALTIEEAKKHIDTLLKMKPVESGYNDPVENYE